MRAEISRCWLIGLGLTLLTATSCFTPQTIKLYQDDKDEEAKLSNNIATFIIEKGYGHKVVLVASVADAMVSFAKPTSAEPVTVGKTMMMVSPTTKHAELEKLVPEVAEFLSKMKLEQSIVDDCLSYATDTGASAEATTLYYLANYQSKWKQWVSADSFESAKAEMKVRVNALGLDF